MGIVSGWRTGLSDCCAKRAGVCASIGPRNMAALHNFSWIMAYRSVGVLPDLFGV